MGDIPQVPPVSQATPLQIYWGVQTFLAGASTLYLLMTKSYRDKHQGQGPDDSLGWLQFRKRVFQQHLLAFFWVVYVLWTALSCYCNGSEARESFSNFYTWATSPSRETTDYTSTVLALVLYTVHIMRRVHESWSVSIFSQRQVLGLFELLRVYSFYIAAGLSLIAEGPPLVELPSCVTIEGLGVRHVMAVVIFYFASSLHHQTLKNFAKLRRNKAGHIVTTEHKLPKGGWFDSVSSPHYFAELMIYTTFGLVLGTTNATWWWLVTYVFTNQFYLAYNTQKYYEKKFEDYPKERKMFIPYLL